MCGIFVYSNTSKLSHDEQKYIYEMFMNTTNRGPDDTKFEYIKCGNEHLYIGFHRLSINDLSNNGNQPMHHENCVLICNGEIYNYNELLSKHNFKYNSTSDCEIIIHLYKKYGIEKTIDMLDGYFSFFLLDVINNKYFVVRDHYGVRPLYMGTRVNADDRCFCSEIKSMKMCNMVRHFEPGTYWSSEFLNDTKIGHRKTFFDYIYNINYEQSMSDILSNIKQLLTDAVHKRMLSDRPIGCLLSGGLDSSLISALVAREFKKYDKVLNTFSIGMPGSTDLYYAQQVAKHIKSNHHHVEVSVEDFLNAIPEVIEAIETYDVTTVRASVGNYLIGKYIKQNTDCTVIFNGDGSDEQSGYLYLKNAPSPMEFQDECISLLKNIHRFDALRSDRSISSKWSLESRTPFLDKKFVQYYMSIDPKLKMYNNKIEKYLLREAFNKDDLLPECVLWRKKEAFSDGCSSIENSWHTVIQKFVNKKISDEVFSLCQNNYSINTPTTKEALYYRMIFEKYYPEKALVLTHFWMPKWCGVQNDPSARELNEYRHTDHGYKETIMNDTINE